MKSIETYLPVFPGFYGTIFEASNEEDEIHDINSQRNQKGLNDVSYNDCEWNYEEFRQGIAADCVNFVYNELNDLFDGKLDIEFQKIVSPRFYNFTNDSINVEFKVSDEFLNSIKAYIFENNAPEFEEYIIDRYTSRSGFISSYSNEVDTWKNEYFDSIEDKGHILGSLLDFVLRNEYDDIEYVMYENCENRYVYAANYNELIGE